MALGALLTVKGYSHKSRFHIRDLLIWVVWLLLALSLIYSSLSVAKSLGMTFFVLNQRSMVQYFVENVLVSPSLDLWIWGAALFVVCGLLFWALFICRRVGRIWVLVILVPFVLVCLAGFGLFGVSLLILASLALAVLYVGFSGSCFGVSWLCAVKGLAVGVVLVLMFVEGACLALFNVPAAMNVGSGFGLGGLHLSFVELGLSNLFYALLPYAYLAFVVLGIGVFVWKLIVGDGFFAKLGGSRLLWFFGRLKEAVLSVKAQGFEPSSGRFPLVAALAISFVVSSLLVAVTVLPWLNPTYRVVSVDAAWYYPRIIHLRGLDVNSAMSWAFATDRPAFFLLLTLLSFVVPTLHLVQFFAALLIPLFCVVSVLVLRLFCQLREALIYTALLAPLSVPALGLIYSGYFANMLAMILVYVYIILLMKVFRQRSAWAFLALLSVSVLILFTHLGTWFVFAASLGTFLFLEWRLAARDRNLWQGFKSKATLVGATIVLGLVCDFVRQMFIPWSTSAFVSTNISLTFGFPDGAFILNGLRVTADFHLGGVFANQVLIFLSIIGFLFMLSFKSEISDFLVSWVFVSSMYMLFASGEYVFNRFLFMMPVLIFSGLGLSFVVRFGARWSKGSNVKKKGVELLILAFVFLVLLNFGLRYVSNLNLV